MKSILGNRKPKPSTPPASSATQSASAEPAAPPKFTPRGAGSKKRILVAVHEGAIDFKAMQPDAAKELNELMHKPEVQAQFGIGPLSQGFDPRHCKRLWQAAGNVLWGMGKLVAKFPSEACEALRFTDEEQEELAKPTASVLDELAPQWLRENQAVAALVLVAGSIIQNKMREAQIIAVRIQKEKTAGTYQEPVPKKPVAFAVDSVPASGRVPIQTPATPADPNANGKAHSSVTTAASGVGPEISGAAPRM